MDLVVTVPKDIWADWIAEGDAVGEPESGEEWGFAVGQRPDIKPGDRLYVVAHERLRGYAVVTRVAETGQGWSIGRRGQAVACTIPERIKGFRGARRRWWDRDAEQPFPDWAVADVPDAQVTAILYALAQRALVRAARATCPMQPQLDLQAVTDLDDPALDEWGANCGPAALAAALGRSKIADVREAVSEGGKFRGYMSITNMKAAIPRAGGRITASWSKPRNAALATTGGEPIIVCIQWGGRWINVPRVAAQFRHFIVYRHGFVGTTGPWVFDINAPNGWMPADQWKANIVPMFLRETAKEGGDNTWNASWAAAVERAP